MNRKHTIWAMVIWLSGLGAASPAWCDLYQADEAAEKQDFPRAFELYRQLAELGQPFPQRFGRRVNDNAAALAGAGVDQAQVGLLIGTIQADDQVVGS